MRKPGWDTRTVTVGIRETKRGDKRRWVPRMCATDVHTPFI